MTSIFVRNTANSAIIAKFQPKIAKPQPTIGKPQKQCIRTMMAGSLAQGKVSMMADSQAQEKVSAAWS